MKFKPGDRGVPTYWESDSRVVTEEIYYLLTVKEVLEDTGMITTLEVDGKVEISTFTTLENILNRRIL